MTRLHALGIPARAACSTVLMGLAAQLPPVVLSKLLGIHICTATHCAHQANPSNAAYAADISRR
jgi:hypothetical protein